MIDINKNNVSEKIINFFEKDVTSIYSSRKPRLYQIQMALDIGNFLYKSRNNIMFLEAPVGTGKTLGSIIPSLFYAKENSKGIVYATATHNLQNQIFSKNGEKDISQRLGLVENNQSILAMGKSMYACYTLYINNKSKFTKTENDKLERFFRESTSGSKMELEKEFDLTLSSSKWLLISLDNSKECTYEFYCKGHVYRKKFKKNHRLTVTNHNQFINSYLKIKHEQSPILFINPGIIIIDEAHMLENNYLSCSDESIGIFELNSFMKNKNQKKHLNKMINEYRRLKSESKSENAKIELDGYMFKLVEKVANDLMGISATYYAYDWFDHSKRLNKLNQAVTILNASINSEYTSWLDIKDNSIHIITNDFVKNYQEFLKSISKQNKVIIMSGTLTSQDDGKAELSRQWKIDSSSFEYHRYPNSFNIKDRSYLYVPKNVAEPNNKDDKHHTEHLTAVKEEAKNLINFSSYNQGTLVLCTSHEYMKEVGIYLHENITNRLVLIQSEKNSTQKIGEQFKDNDSSILVGSDSFATGFSVKGRSLQNLLISKLPYPVPSDPIFKLRKRVSNLSDSEISNRMMLIKLEQAMGRLIRDSNDYGIIEIVDPRIYHKKHLLKWLNGKGYNINDHLQNFNSFEKNLSNDNKTNHKYSRDELNIPSITHESYEKVDIDQERIKLYNSNSTNNDNEAKKWAINLTKRITKCHPEARKVKKNYNNARACYQTIIDVLYSINVNNNKSEYFKDFPFSNNKQRLNFEKISPSKNAIPPVKISYKDRK